MQSSYLPHLLASPLGWPLRPALDALGEAREAVPSVAAIDAALAAPAGVRFVEAPPRPSRRRRREAAVDPAAYDASIVERGVVPTRAGNLHDLANALAWATFPRSKRALHARQLGVVRAAARPGVPWSRTEEGDALAMLDEGGIVVIAPAADLATVQEELTRGDDVALAARAAAGRALGVVFGHAVVEQIAGGAPPVAGLALALAGDPTRPDLGALDEALAARIASPEEFRSRRGHGIASARPDVLGSLAVSPAASSDPSTLSTTSPAPCAAGGGASVLLGALLVLATTACDPTPDVAIAATSVPSASSAAASTSAAAARAPSSAWVASLDGAPSTSVTRAVASAPGSASVVPSASAAPAAPPAPCPEDMVLVGRTCVDRYEAHLLVPGEDGALVLHPFNERPPGGVRFVAANAAGQKPQGYISRVESLAACTAAGKRLCTRPEWQRACRGPGGSRWPYAQQGERGRCNSGKPHLLTVHFGDVRGIKYDEHFNSPILNADPVGLAPSGAHAGCTNEAGTFDMVGNLHEWVAGTVDSDLVYEMEEEKVQRRDQPWQSGNGIFMGGFYSTTSEHGAGCSFTTIAHEPSYHDYSTGFRCCRDAVLPRKGSSPSH